MHSTLKSWLEKLEDGMEIVASDEVNEEAHKNMISFAVNKELLQEWGKQSVLEFLKGCADLYKKKSSYLNMVFYSWFDEQASQIRISAVSQTHKQLLFNCKFKSVDLHQVVNGLYSEDSGLYTKGALDVWCQNI